MKIGIIVTNFGRTRILNIFGAGIARLRAETGFDIPVTCVGDIDGADICHKYDIMHIEYPNRPLTGKFNRACKSMEDRVDYVLVMGSDDLLSTRSFLAIHAEAEKGIDLIGLSEVYFFGMDDVHSGKLIHFRHTTVLGVARTIKASVLDNLSWEPWTQHRDRSIDTIMLDAVRPYVKTRALLNGEFVVDLKTSMNLNPIRFWAKKLGAMPNADLLWNNIGAEERRLIEEYLA